MAKPETRVSSKQKDRGRSAKTPAKTTRVAQRVKPKGAKPKSLRGKPNRKVGRATQSAAVQKRDSVGWPARSRTLRDPIHKDIRLGPLEAAVIDTRIFQRLRYIRQNGLLHFVFPGAVHTRFSHSLGTMFVAGRVFETIFREPKKSARASERADIDYLGAVFGLAALLHDVGHCAFSHSIEGVSVEGQPFLGTTCQLFKEWDQQDLLKEYLEVYPAAAQSPVSHEQIGLILVDEIFRQPRVVDACEHVLAVSALDVGRDVRAIMDGGLAASQPFALRALRAFEAVRRAAPAAAPFTAAERETFASDLLAILHNLVSGTLDVDRLDYLVRDSFHCGVPYGVCEVQLLTTSLSIGPFEGNTVLLLSEKAAYALDDMLWSRYQLFIQVLNHKTNVGLNAAFNRAIEDAVGDGLIRRPPKLVDFIAFTDDKVMSTVITACLHGGKLADRSYAKALVDRRVPLHCHSEDAGTAEEDLRERFAKENNVSADAMYVGEGRSELIKGGPLPKLVSWDRRTGERRLRPFRDGSTVSGPAVAPAVVHKVHVFVDRGAIEARGEGEQNG